MPLPQNAFSETEPINGPSYAAAQKIAALNNISLLYTFPEKDATTGVVYDTATIIFRNGTTLAHYRCSHRFN